MNETHSQPHPHSQVLPPPQPQQSNGLGIASLILGVLSITIFGILTGIPAIITGAMGIKNPASKSMSIAGIITGAISIVFTVLVVLFFGFILAVSAGMASESDRRDYGPSVQPETNYNQQRT